jgi:hypothetical protein
MLQALPVQFPSDINRELFLGNREFRAGNREIGPGEAGACWREVRFNLKVGSDGLSFRIFNALRGRAFFPDGQREAQLLPNITRRGCA